MLEFIHLSGAEAGKDEDTRRKVRSQAMRDFRKRQREEKESGSRKRPSRPSSVQGTTLEWHPLQRSVSDTSSTTTRPRSNASARPPVATTSTITTTATTPDLGMTDTDPNNLPIHVPNGGTTVRPTLGQRAISHPMTNWTSTAYLTPSLQLGAAVPAFDYTAAYLDAQSQQFTLRNQPPWLTADMQQPLQYPAPTTMMMMMPDQPFNFCDSCASATIYPGLCDTCANGLLSRAPLNETWCWKTAPSLNNGALDPKMEWMC